MNTRLRSPFRVVLACAVFLLIAGVASAQSQIQGLITGRSGATMTVKTSDNETIVVALTADTQVQEVQGALKMRKKELGMTALIPGLSVQVKGVMNGQHQLVADTVKFKGSDLKIVQVQGYASAVGSAALNQKLSMERANNVLAYLEQDGKIPLTNILAPGAMGTSDQVAPNATTEGQAENRRVVVRILQNKGIAGT
jgi:hypothetical protein